MPSGQQLQVVPLLLLHGWPGSFVEFRRALQLLSRPRPGHQMVFELICPSLPGYGFSSAAARPGLGVPEVAATMRKLMLRLGFERFFVQGGDWGSAIANTMGTMYPDNVRGKPPDDKGQGSFHKVNIGGYYGLPVAESYNM